MNKNLPREIWDMIEVVRRREFRKRVVEFNSVFISNVFWKLFLCYRSFWRRETYNSPSVYHLLAYTMSKVRFQQSYIHENRSGFRRGPRIIILMHIIIHFKNGLISHYEFIKRGEFGHEIIQYFHPFHNE